MKTISKYFALGLLVLAFIATSCKKDEQQASVGFSMKANATESPDQPAKQPVDEPVVKERLDLRWDIAWIYITSVEFNAQYNGFTTEDDDDKPKDIHLEWNGNQQVNLLEEPKIFADLELEIGLYDHIWLSMASARLTDTYGPNFYLSGNFGPVLGGTPIAVSVTQPFKMTMQFDGWTINTEKDSFFNGLIEISLDRVFNGISAADLRDAQLYDGWILIDATHNTHLYAVILANLKAQGDDGLHWDDLINP